MTTPTTRERLRLLAGAALIVPLTSCVTVQAPDKPIEINLKVDITQEVLVSLRPEVQQIIRQNPDAFPRNPGGSQ